MSAHYLFRPVFLFVIFAVSIKAAPADGVETIKIRNAMAEAEITVKPFVHLLGFRFIDGKNHLLNYTTPNPTQDGHPIRPLFIVGAKLWYAPEVNSSHLFGMLSGQITRDQNEVAAKLEVDPVSHLQGRIRFVLDEKAPRLTISSALRNVGSKPILTGCWWPVSFETGGTMETTPLKSATEPAFTYHFWSFDDAGSSAICQITPEGIKLDLDHAMSAPLFKAGCISREVVVRKSDTVYRLTALDPPVDPAGFYPHGGSPVMLYRDGRTDFCEAELSGPLKTLEPGSETTFTFSIQLERPK